MQLSYVIHKTKIIFAFLAFMELKMKGCCKSYCSFTKHEGLKVLWAQKLRRQKDFQDTWKPKQIMGKIPLNLNPNMEHENQKHNMNYASAKNEVQMKYILITY